MTHCIEYTSVTLSTFLFRTKSHRHKSSARINNRICFNSLSLFMPIKLPKISKWFSTDFTPEKHSDAEWRKLFIVPILGITTKQSNEFSRHYPRMWRQANRCIITHIPIAGVNIIFVVQNCELYKLRLPPLCIHIQTYQFWGEQFFGKK